MNQSRTVLLQGNPGSGKSRMAALTAVRKPVHVIDIDRKIKGSAWARSALDSQQLTYWELAEPLDEGSMVARVKQLTSSEKASQAPKGWASFANYYQKLPEIPEGKAAGTWVVDTGTQLGEHFKSHIMYLSGKNKLTFDQWMAYLTGWRDTLSFMRDLALENDKDLILIVHERDSEVAGDRTTGVKYENMPAKFGEEPKRERVVLGTMDLAINASIDGSFGKQIAGYFNECYWLYVKAGKSEDDMPEWKCRVVPDGKRSLRTSFNVKQAVFNPDFREIWK